MSLIVSTSIRRLVDPVGEREEGGRKGKEEGREERSRRGKKKGEIKKRGGRKSERLKKEEVVHVYQEST